MSSFLLVASEMTTQEALEAMGANFWALIPAVTAIVLALLTKEVYISLFLGIFVGGMIFAKGNPISALEKIFEIMAGSMGPETESHVVMQNGAPLLDEFGNIITETKIIGAGNAGILIFILELGILIAMMNKAGGTKAFGRWVHNHVKSRKGALLATTGIGCLMFMDDYFNRLAVGSIMQPINDQFRISRAKSAFIIGSISVSICILIPVSSWASAITVYVGPEAGGFSTYIETIGCNFYPILLLLFLFASAALGIDLFGLYRHEHTAITTGDLLCGMEPSRGEEEVNFNVKGKAIDLILPITVLVISCCILLLIKKDGEAIFATNTALAMGGCISIIFCLLLYLPRRLMSLKDYTGCFGTGFKSIADVFIILVFAWGLVDMCKALNLNSFVEAFAYWMQDLNVLLPAILFLAAMGCAFATGTSWGTFGIMVPIVAGMGPALGHSLMVITMGAVLSGSVFGDQVSPISDATILAAASCKSNHLGYVKAQMPSALLIAAIAFVSFLVTGLCTLGLNGFVPVIIGWIVALILFTAFILTAYLIQRKKGGLTDKLYKDILSAAKPEPADQPTAE